MSVFFAYCIHERNCLTEAIKCIRLHNESPVVYVGLGPGPFQVIEGNSLPDALHQYSRGQNLPLSGTLYFVKKKVWLIISCLDTHYQRSQHWFNMHKHDWHAVDISTFITTGRLLASGSFLQLVRMYSSLVVHNDSVLWIPNARRHSCFL